MAGSMQGTLANGRTLDHVAASRVLGLVFAVFFLLGGITNINDLLVAKFKDMFELSHFAANLVQFAFFTSYALFSIPAGMLVARLGYIRSFVLGFIIVAAASLLFIPASRMGTYAGFLIGLFMIGGGITVLQVAMNPVVTILGPPETSHSRLTFAQLFNSMGVTLMVYGGARLLLGTGDVIDSATTTPDQATAHRIAEGALVANAYAGLALLMLAIAALFWFSRSALDTARAASGNSSGTLSLFCSSGRVRFAAICIFAYVGAEVAIGSNLVAYLSDPGVMGLTAVAAGQLLAFYWGGAMIGRFVGGFVLRSFRPGAVLMAYATGAILLIALSASSAGMLAGWSLLLVGFCNSLMFPTIFSLGTEGLSDDAPKASGILCTAIVGGALVPPLFGLVADATGSVRAALAIPVVCYLVITGFGWWTLRNGASTETLTPSGENI